MHKPTKRNKEQVVLWCRNGIPRQLIAESLDISYQTLMKYYKPQILSGETDATNTVANELYAMATSFVNGNTTMTHAIKLKAMMFWLEKRGGQAWKPTAQVPYLQTLAEIKDVDVIKEATDIFSTLAEPRPYEKGISKYIERPRS
jgi:hypothetical protein